MGAAAYVEAYTLRAGRIKVSGLEVLKYERMCCWISQ